MCLYIRDVGRFHTGQCLRGDYDFRLAINARCRVTDFQRAVIINGGALNLSENAITIRQSLR